MLQPLHWTCRAWDQLICALLFLSIVVAGAELEGVRGAELLEALTTHAALVCTLAILAPNDYPHGSEQLEYGCLRSLIFWASCTRIQTFHLNSVPFPHEALSALLVQTSLRSVSMYYIDLISLRLPPHNDLFSRLKALKIIDCVATLVGACGLCALKLWERAGTGTLDALCCFLLQAPLLSSLTLAVGDGEGEGTPPGWSLPVIPAPMVHVLHALVSHLVHLTVLLVKDHAGLTVTALDGLVRVAPALEHLGIAGIGGEALPQASLNATSMALLLPMPGEDALEHREHPQVRTPWIGVDLLLGPRGGWSRGGRRPGPERARHTRAMCTTKLCGPPILQADMAAGWSGLRACAACDLTIVMLGEGFTGAGGASPIVAYGMGVAEKHSAWSVARGLPSLTFHRLFCMTQVAWQPDRR
ncbi:hypothetical protein K439DRAFT_1613964 [Ramaria rubella]|nr:hypothetical protein K439DRAFT_1613964 [Ramaria rubella]